MKNNNCIHHVPYLRNRKACNHNFWYNCVKWWYPQLFFSFFEIFILWAARGVKGQKLPKMKNNYIRLAPYLRNSMAYNHDLWYICVKWWYLQLFFLLFEIFIFWAVRGIKLAKNCPKWKTTITSVMHCISRTVWHIIMIFGTLV